MRMRSGSPRPVWNWTGCDSVRSVVKGGKYICHEEYLPGLLNSAAIDKAVQTTKSFSALFANRNTSDPPTFSFHEVTVATMPLSTLDKSLELRPIPRPVR